MTLHNNNNLPVLSEWLSQIHAIKALQKDGQFIVTMASSKNPVVIAWQKTDILSSKLAEFKVAVSDCVAHAVASAEVQFLRVYPAAVSQELFLKSCAPLLDNGIDQVDWQQVESCVANNIKQFYLMDIISFGEKVIQPLLQDIYFSVMATDQNTGQLLGCVLFAITPALACGDVKMIHAVARDNELEKALMSTIFHIVPSVKRLFCAIRPTNEQTIKRYSSWGFVREESPVHDPYHAVNWAHFVVLEYKADQSDVLQKVARQLA